MGHANAGRGVTFLVRFILVACAGCATAAGQNTAQSSPELLRLRQAVHSDSFDTRYKAVAALRRLGPAGVPVLIEAVEDPYDLVRRDAVEALGDMGAAASRAVPTLERVLRREPESGTRMSAAVALGQIGSVRSVKVLHAAVADKDHLVVEAAIEALGRFGPRASIAAYDIATHLDTLSSLSIRVEAEGALVRIGAAGIPEWMRLVRDLGRPLPGEAPRRDDEEIDPDAWDRQLEFVSRASVVVEKIGPPALEPLVRIARRNDKLTQPHAVYLIGWLGPAARSAVPLLQQLTTSPFPNTRERAEAALRQIMQ